MLHAIVFEKYNTTKKNGRVGKSHLPSLTMICSAVVFPCLGFFGKYGRKRFDFLNLSLLDFLFTGHFISANESFNEI